jgi:hypothetical protein
MKEPMTSNTQQGSQYAHLFPYGWGKNLILSEESLTFITPAKTSLVIARIVRAVVREQLPHKKTFTVLDATANHGGDTIALGVTKGFRVTSCEIDPQIAKSLQHNLQQYSLQIPVYCDDLRNFLEETTGYDVLYVDPPFGPEYDDPNITSYVPQICNESVAQVIARYVHKFAVIEIKVPRKKFDFEAFRKEFDENKVHLDYRKLSQNSRHKLDFVLITHRNK